MDQYTNVSPFEYAQYGKPVTENIEQYKINTGLPTIDQVVGGGGDVLGASDKKDKKEEKKVKTYDKTAVASQLGVSKRGLEALAEAAGYGSTEEYYEGLKNEVGEVFDPVFKYLKEAKAALEGQQPGVEQDIRSLYGEAEAGIRTEEQQALRGYEQEEKEAAQGRKNALTEAASLYNEIIQGGQQRYGGSSSAGEAFQAIAGRELQRESAGIRENYQTFMNNMALAKTTLKENVGRAIQNIKTQVATAINQSRRDFQNKLLEISRYKAEAEGDKAALRLEALQNLRNQIYEIKLAEQQNTQSVIDYQDYVNNVIDDMSGRMVGIGPSAGDIQGAGVSLDIGQPAAGPADELALTGIVSPRRKDEELFNYGTTYGAGSNTPLTGIGSLF